MSMTTVGDIGLNLKITGTNISSQIRQQVQAPLRSVNKTVNGSLNNGFKALGKTIAAAFSIRMVVRFGAACVDAASQAEAAWAGLRSILDGQGKSFSQANAFLQEYISDGLVPLTNAVTAYKNLAMRGYNTEQIEKTLIALKDSAAFGRQASLSYGQAIQSATEGLKNENSILVDNAGVTKNVSKMWEDYARSIGTTAKKLTQQQKIQAEVNGILQETKWQTGDAAKYSQTYAGQVATLNANFLIFKQNLGSLLTHVLLPIIKALNVMLTAINKVLSAYSTITPGSSGMGAVAEDVTTTATGLDDATDSAKKLKKSLSGIDKLNVVGSSDSSDGSSGGGVGATGGAGGLTVNDTLKKGVENGLSEIAALFTTGGVVLLGLGAVLAFTGVSIPLGIALMATGALSLWSSTKMDPNAAKNSVISGMDLVAGAVSLGVLAIGAVLAFTGVNLPLGIALIATGAAGLWSTASLNWNALTDGVSNTVGTIAGVLSGASLVVGAVLAFTGVGVPLGIALMAVGAAGLAAAFVPKWSGVSDKVKETVAVISQVLGGSLLVIGVILALTGAGTALGLGLMAAGAVGLAAAFAPRWNELSDKTKNTLSIISGIAGISLLALGVILLCTGAGIPLGLGMIAAGGVGLAAAIAPNWSKITNGVKSVCTTISGFFTNCLNGIKSGFKAVVNGIIDGLNFFIKGANKLKFDIPDWIPGIGGKKWGLNIPTIPKLAQGGYVEANTPQLAIIGDNKHEGEIVAPESKITEAVMAAMGPLLAEMRALVNAVNRGNSGSNNQVFKGTVDGKVLFEWFVNKHNSIVRQTGKSPLKV